MDKKNKSGGGSSSGEETGGGTKHSNSASSNNLSKMILLRPTSPDADGFYGGGGLQIKINEFTPPSSSTSIITSFLAEDSSRNSQIYHSSSISHREYMKDNIRIPSLQNELQGSTIQTKDQV